MSWRLVVSFDADADHFSTEVVTPARAFDPSPSPAPLSPEAAPSTEDGEDSSTWPAGTATRAHTAPS
jgi:hypothetical protein